METGRTNAPLVSVIVINWNGMKFLDACLASLEKQTWESREFILVDNGSTDGSREYMRKWTERVPNARMIPLSKNTGFCKANI